MAERVIERDYHEWMGEVLGQIGVRAMSDEEVQASYERAVEAINVGVFDPEWAFTGMGVRPIDTRVYGYSEDELESVPEGTRALVCNFGGTKWQVYEVMKSEGKVKKELWGEREFGQEERRFGSTEEFVEMMVREMMAGKKPEEMPEFVGVAFGFPMDPVESEVGVGLVRENEDLGKFWWVEGLGGVDIGKAIVDKAKALGWGIGTIVMDNDTINDALAVPGAAGGGVGGSGTNFCTRVSGVNEDALMNLECGKWREVFRAYPLVGQMEVRGLLGSWGYVAEVETGGDFLVGKLKTLRDMFGLNWLSDQAIKEYGSRILSVGAKGDKERLSEMVGREVTEEQVLTLKTISEPIMTRAGQALGVMVAAAAAMTGEGKPKYGVEGSVLLKGVGVRQAMEETVVKLGQRVELVEADPMGGLGGYVMVRGRKSE